MLISDNADLRRRSQTKLTITVKMQQEPKVGGRASSWLLESKMRKQTPRTEMKVGDVITQCALILQVIGLRICTKVKSSPA